MKPARARPPDSVPGCFTRGAPEGAGESPPLTKGPSTGSLPPQPKRLHIAKTILTNNKPKALST